RYVCLYGWEVGRSIVQLASRGNHGLPDGFAQQCLGEILAGHIKGSAASPVSAAAGPDQRSAASFGQTRSRDCGQDLAGGGINHSGSDVANCLRFTLLHAAYAKTSGDSAERAAAHSGSLVVTPELGD